MAKKKKVKFGSIVPLVGGMTMGCMKALKGQKPEWLVSYPGFWGNDRHLVNYLGEKVPYLKLDPETNLPLNESTGELNEDGEDIIAPTWDLDDLDGVDFVNAVPPCSGLSLLNSSTKKDSSTSRGSHAAQNDWMYKTSSFILENVKPKVFWGENAPGLYTKNGMGVVENLKEIAKKYGYSLSLMKTDTFLHGVPQKRTRTFFFFWNTPTAPLMGYYNRDKKTLAEYLAEVPEDATMQDVYLQGENGSDVMKNKFIEWLVNVDGKKPQDLHSMGRKGYKTFFMYIVCEDSDKAPGDKSRRKLHDVIDWFESFTTQEDVENRTSNGKYLKALYHVKNKWEMKKGWWDASPHFWNEHINAVIGRTMEQSIHPTEMRYINVREYMHLMGLPHDFELADGSKAWYHISQNVPVNTTADWASQVLEFINGNLEDSGAFFVKQNNVKQKIDYLDKSIVAKELFKKPTKDDEMPAVKEEKEQVQIVEKVNKQLF